MTHNPRQTSPEQITKIITRGGKLEAGREFWLNVHDIVRDKSDQSFTVQDVIDIASEAYELYTGESIQEWFKES